MVILDLGCGPKKAPGSIGVDRAPFAGVDVIWDLEKFPYPFQEDSADRAILSHCLEHFENPLRVLRETARVVKPGGLIHVYTPHYSSMNAYSDMTHRHAFSLHAFRLLSLADLDEDSASSYQAYVGQMGDSTGSQRRVELRLVKSRLSFWKLHDALNFVPCRWIGIEWLANSFPVFYERFLSFLFPSNEISVVFEVVKR